MKIKKHNYILFDQFSYKSTVICSLIMICLFILFIFIFFVLKIQFSTSYIGVVGKDDDYYVYMLITDDEIASLSLKYLIYNGKRVDYNIISISDEYVLTDSGPKRYAYLDVRSDYEKIINNVLKLNFVYDCTMFQYIKEDRL